MQDFIKAFIRDEYGVWRCITATDVKLPTGRIQVLPGTVFVRGTRFMNIDLALLLDVERDRRERRRP